MNALRRATEITSLPSLALVNITIAEQPGLVDLARVDKLAQGFASPQGQGG
jgi:hypothetical protein